MSATPNPGTPDYPYSSSGFSAVRRSRPSPFQSSLPATTAASPITSSSPNNAMAPSGFHSNQPASRPSAVSTPSFATLPSTASMSSLAAPSTTMVRVRRLPAGTDEKNLQFMLFFTQTLTAIEILPSSFPGEESYCEAILTFETREGAVNAKNSLDGMKSLQSDVAMIAEVVSTPTSSVASSRTSNNQSSHGSSHLLYTYGSSNDGATTYGNSGTVPTTTVTPDSSRTEPAGSTHYQGLYTRQPAIGNHLQERTRMSGKALINNDTTLDDDTPELLKDPLAYIEDVRNPPANNNLGDHAAPVQYFGQPQLTQPQPVRQSTSSRISALTQRVNGLSLQTTALGGSSTGHSGSNSAISGFASPMSANLPLQMPGLNPSMEHQPLYQYQQGHHYARNHSLPPANPADQNPPCNTLYVGNLPGDTSEEELKALFVKQRGYKRLCFRTKSNGPMCFVEFESITFATKTLNDLYGTMLHNSVKGGIRLSFSKNPLGVRSGQNQNNNGAASGMGGGSSIMPNVAANGFAAANGPPPGLAPPGLSSGRMPYSQSTTSNGSSMNGGGVVGSIPNGGYHTPQQGYTSAGVSNGGWANASLYQTNLNGSMNGSATGNVNGGPYNPNPNINMRVNDGYFTAGR